MQLSGGLVPSPADHSELVAELEPTPPMAPVGMGDTQPWHLSLAAVPAARVPVHTSPDVGDPDAFSSIAWLRVPDTSPVQFAATSVPSTRMYGMVLWVNVVEGLVVAVDSHAL